MLQALFPQAIFMPKQRAVYAKVKIQSRILHSPIQALIDSGTIKNFISPNVIDHFNISVFKTPAPRIIHNIDGSKNSIGSVTHAVNLEVRHKDATEMHQFYIIDLGSNSMLLGMPFLAITNPDINWSTGQIQGKVITLTTNSQLWTSNKDNWVYIGILVKKL